MVLFVCLFVCLLCFGVEEEEEDLPSTIFNVS